MKKGGHRASWTTARIIHVGKEERGTKERSEVEEEEAMMPGEEGAGIPMDG